MLYQKYVQRSLQLECITYFSWSSKRPYTLPIILPLPTPLANAKLLFFFPMNLLFQTSHKWNHNMSPFIQLLSFCMF